jgi:hypothetical protein
MSKEKFMNPDIKKDPEDNKKEVEKRKNAELKAKTRSYMQLVACLIMYTF